MKKKRLSEDQIERFRVYGEKFGSWLVNRGVISRLNKKGQSNPARFFIILFIFIAILIVFSVMYPTPIPTITPPPPPPREIVDTTISNINYHLKNRMDSTLIILSKDSLTHEDSLYVLQTNELIELETTKNEE